MHDRLLQPGDAVDNPAMLVGEGIPEVVGPGAKQESHEDD